MGNSASTAPALAGKTHDPAFVWKIHGFSALLNRGVKTIKSAPFECSGYKWYLLVAPYNKKNCAMNPYVSVALGLCIGSLDLERDYKMDVVFQLSMYNHSEKTYRGCRDFYDFYGTQTRSWVECLIPLKSLLKSSDFLVDDCCVFGAEILLVDVFPSGKKGIVVPEKATTVQNVFILNSGFISWTYNLSMPNFLESNMMDCTCSQAVEFDGHKWCYNNALSVSSVPLALMSNAQGLSPYNATASSSLEADTTRLMYTTPSGVTLLVVSWLPRSAAPQSAVRRLLLAARRCTGILFDKKGDILSGNRSSYNQMRGALRYMKENQVAKQRLNIPP